MKFSIALLVLSTGLGFGGCKESQARETEAIPPKKVTEITWVSSPKEPINVAKYILEESRKSIENGKKPVVYVGAKWCEPCTHFKKAVRSGQLNKIFPTLYFIELDRDNHGDGLELAGYGSRYIPLFCLPEKTTGKSSKKCIQGSIKGPGALGNIVPRLRGLIEAPKSPKSTGKD